MSYLMPHLNTGWAVDQAILSEEERLVVVRFGHDYDPTCMQMDEVLYGIAELVKNYAVIYLVDTTEVPDFNTMYELYDPCTVMFFFRNKVRLCKHNCMRLHMRLHESSTRSLPRSHASHTVSTLRVLSTS
jgi:thiol-disulfide isomerase/thioredoxin